MDVEWWVWHIGVAMAMAKKSYSKLAGALMRGETGHLLSLSLKDFSNVSVSQHKSDRDGGFSPHCKKRAARMKLESVLASC